VCQIYVGDNIFGSTNQEFFEWFGEMMAKELDMSMTGDGISVSQAMYLKEMLKKFGMEDAKPIRTLMKTNGHLDLDGGENPVG
jgi:hypothetical protein